MPRLSTALYVLLAVALALAVFLVYARCQKDAGRKVQGPSMEPAISDGDTIHVSDYGDESPQRGDIVLYRFPEDTKNEFLGRIVGKPGETVEVRDGLVLIDGSPLDEPYIADKAQYSYGPKKVPPNNYFVLGDNRNNSFDSHAWGFLPAENIIGRVEK